MRSVRHAAAGHFNPIERNAVTKNDTGAAPLPSVLGDETIISLQKAVADAKPGAKEGLDGFFKRREIIKGSELFEVGKVPTAIYMLRSGTVRLKVVDGRPVKDMPVTTLYHAAPDKSMNRPLLGARYYFNRTPCSLAYVAETPCAVYEISSGALADLHDTNRQAVILLVYWLLASSDLSDIFVPIVNKALGLEAARAGDTQGLLRAVEEFRAAREDPRMPGLLYKLYKRFATRRMERGAELGLEPSVVHRAPVPSR